MKKVSIALLAAVLLAGTGCIAIQTVSVNEQKAINETTSQQYTDIVKSAQNENSLQWTELSKRYEKNLRTCEPAHFAQTLDLFGLKISFNADINGWVDNKCSYSLTGKIHSVGKDIREVYNLNFADEDIAKIEPQIKCDFTKTELNTLVDGILDASQTAGKTTKVTSKKETTSLTPAEQKAAEMLLSGKVCTVPNMNEVMQQYMNLNSQP